MCCTGGSLLGLSSNQIHGNISQICQFSTEQCMQSLFSLRFLTLTLSAPQGTVPKDRLTGTSDRVVVVDHSEYVDCVTLSVAEFAHLLDNDMDRVGYRVG